MPVPDVSAETASEPIPDDLVEAGLYPSYAIGFEHSLVVLAMMQPCWLVPADDSFRLLVEPQSFPDVRAQLACFDRESAGWPPRPVLEGVPTHPVAFATQRHETMSVLLNKHGRRYTNERYKMHAFGYEMCNYDSYAMAYPRVPSYWVFDEKRRKLGPSQARQ